jgi:DNA-binding MarR family transcriptional regulator
LEVKTMPKTEADRIMRARKLQRERQEEAMRVATRLPLSALLSQVLVAFTIEFDNEFEHQMPHRTSKHRSTPGSPYAPWLVSLAMWSNCMQFVGEEGVTVGELQRLARTTTNLAGMQRWGYIIVESGPADSRSKQPRPEAVVHPTPAGRKAQEVWQPLFGLIEERWQARFGKAEIDQLRESLWGVASQLDVELPDCLPILGYGLFSGGRHPGDARSLGTQADYERRVPDGRGSDGASRLPLPALLSRVLLAFAIEFERESDVSLAISANVLRVLDEQGVRVRDLPLLSGVSKEAMTTALRFLQKYSCVIIEPNPASSRGKVVRLTPQGREAQDAYYYLVWAIEERWQTRFGRDTISGLRRVLERLVGEATAQLSPLFKGLEPYPDGWRASVRKPDILPHYPMVLHRGGFPDGS